jgi:hypothetical protein
MGAGTQPVLVSCLPSSCYISPSNQRPSPSVSQSISLYIVRLCLRQPMRYNTWSWSWSYLPLDPCTSASTEWFKEMSGTGEYVSLLRNKSSLLRMSCYFPIPKLVLRWMETKLPVSLSTLYHTDVRVRCRFLDTIDESRGWQRL